MTLKYTLIICLCVTYQVINANVINAKRDVNDEQYKNILHQLVVSSSWAQYYQDELAIIFDVAKEEIEAALTNDLDSIDYEIDYITQHANKTHGDAGKACVDTQLSNVTEIKDGMVAFVGKCLKDKKDNVDTLIKKGIRIFTIAKDKSVEMRSEWKACGKDRECRLDIIMDGYQDSRKLIDDVNVLETITKLIKEIHLTALEDCANEQSLAAAGMIEKIIGAITICLALIS